MDFTALDREQDASDILFAHAGAGILEAAGDADVFLGVIDVLDRVEARDHIGVGIGGLTVRQDIAGAYGVAPAEFPRVDADHLGEQIDVALGRKAALRHAEAAISARGGVVGIDRHTEDVDVLIVIGTCRMSAGAVEDGAAERSICAGIGDDNALHAGQDAVLVTGGSELHLHRMSFDMIV